MVTSLLLSHDIAILTLHILIHMLTQLPLMQEKQALLLSWTQVEIFLPEGYNNEMTIQQLRHTVIPVT